MVGGHGGCWNFLGEAMFWQNPLIGMVLVLADIKKDNTEILKQCSCYVPAAGEIYRLKKRRSLARFLANDRLVKHNRPFH